MSAVVEEEGGRQVYCTRDGVSCRGHAVLNLLVRVGVAHQLTSEAPYRRRLGQSEAQTQKAFCWVWRTGRCQDEDGGCEGGVYGCTGRREKVNDL